MRVRLSLFALLAGLAFATTAVGEPVRFPLNVDYDMLSAAVATQLGAGADGSAVVWGTAGGCRSLLLRDVTVDRAGDRVRISAAGRARAGVGFLGFCFSPLSWEGFLETRVRPLVGVDWQLRLRDLDSSVLDPQRQRTLLASNLWDVVRGRVEERMSDFAFDLGPPVDEVKTLLRASLRPDRSEAALAAIDSLRPVETVVDDDGVRVLVSIDIPAPTAPPGAQPEPLASADELRRWQAALDRWDAFLTFVVKGLGIGDPDPAVRETLLDILLESRHSVLAALRDPPQPGVDPVRTLFLEAWERLRIVVRQAMKRRAPQERALRFTAFLSAGDALAAIDTIGNGLGLEISADGLRRLARILVPADATDPLAYSDDTDDELRSLFGFHDPDAGEPFREEPIVPQPEPGAWWWRGPRGAVAAEPAPPDLAAVARRLDRWVPTGDDLPAYREQIGRLLALVGDHERQRSGVDDRFAELYGHLVPSVAWQESCWRQFVREGGAVTFLLSGTGDVGIMQVNRRVWRGFFDVKRLEWDIAYNVGAGAEILAQLLDRYGRREGAARLENAARATYSAYNGGPAAYRRYRSASAARVDRAVDRAFWEKYQAMAAGRALDYVLCTEAWGARPKG